MSPLKLQKGALSVVVGVIAGHCIMDIHGRRIGLGHFANVFCRSCRDEIKEETVPHLLGTCPALCQRRMNDLEELLVIDIASLNRFIRSSK